MSGGLLLEIPEGQLKNSHPASMPLPKQCADLVRIYIKRFRPLLAPEGSPFLFTGEHADRCKDPNCLGKQMKVLVHEKLGFDVNAHLFRHLVHIVVLNRFPGAFGMVARVLTHHNINTTIQNYIYMDVELSMRAYQALVMDEASGAAQSKRASPADVAYRIDSERL